MLPRNEYLEKIKKQVGESRAKYGDGLIKELSIQITKDFGKGFMKRNLWLMRQFYSLFPKLAAVRRELSWSNYSFYFIVTFSLFAKRCKLVSQLS